MWEDFVPSLEKMMQNGTVASPAKDFEAVEMYAPQKSLSLKPEQKVGVNCWKCTLD
jgi:hypothetical protein